MNLLAAMPALAALLLAPPGAASAGTLTVRLTGSVNGHSSAACFLVLPSRVVGGGTATYCLARFTGRPGPNAVVHDSGVMSFALPNGSIRTRVSIVQRFAADGAHARQTLRGSILGGTRRYAHARGTIGGGGSLLERPPGHVASSDLRYVLRLR